MKKQLIGVCTLSIALALAACGTAAPTAGTGGGETTATESERDMSNPLESVIAKAEVDFSDTAQKILDEEQSMLAEVGDTYEDYVQNVDKVQAWYDFAVDQTEQLGERAVEYGREYYQAVVDNVDVTDDRDLEKATEEFYDAIYEDAYDDYYDAVYEDAFDDAYDAFYDGIIQDARDSVPYDEWSDVRSDAYKAWSDARSDVYAGISDYRSDIYSDYADVRGAFYNNDFDIEALFAPVEIVEKTDEAASAEQADDGDDAATETGATAKADSSGSVSADFKATMDSYEAFFDKYVEFMKAYTADPSSTDLMSQYADMLTQYTDTMSSLGSIDTSSLSASDYAYYVEVSARITEKLATIGA